MAGSGGGLENDSTGGADGGIFPNFGIWPAARGRGSGESRFSGRLTYEVIDVYFSTSLLSVTCPVDDWRLPEKEDEAVAPSCSRRF